MSLAEFSVYLDGPDGLFKWVEELEAEAILLGGSLDELAGVEQDSPDPLAVLIGLIDEQDSWLQHTPQLGPALQCASDLKEKKRNWTFPHVG